MDLDGKAKVEGKSDLQFSVKWWWIEPLETDVLDMLCL